jgi:2-methylcitrate dehydratase PrpD
VVGLDLASALNGARRVRSVSCVKEIADYWSGVGFADIPASAVAAAKQILLDTLAAGVAGSGTAVTSAALAGARASLGGARGDAIIWGRSDGGLPPVQAALVNGTSAHALELDDFGGCGHTAAVIVPVAMALARGHSGKEIITALAAGYDLASRTLEATGAYRAHNDRGWHSTGTCGSFGAAATAATLLSLDAKAYANALAIAGSFTGGLWAFLVDGAMTKHLHAGKAAETGLTAAYLAQAGMTGPGAIFEAEWGGFLSSYAAGGNDPEQLTRELGRDFHIHRLGIKIYACCRGLHYPLDALLELMAEHDLAASDIRSMTMHATPQHVRQFNRPSPAKRLDAQFSAQYCLAVLARYGRASLAEFEPLHTEDPDVSRLMSATRVVVDSSLASTDFPWIAVDLADGRTLSRAVAFARGAPENPVADRDVKAKALQLLTPVLGEGQAQELMAGVDRLDELSSLDRLFSLLQPRTAR